MYEKLINQLIRHEGEVFKPYTCPAGYITIGVGRNLEGKGITQEESRHLLRNDISECEGDLMGIFPKWNSFSENRVIALIDMRFNLGPSRFRSFRRMIAQINAGNWELAGTEAMDSKWAREDVGKSRSGRIYAQLVGG